MCVCVFVCVCIYTYIYVCVFFEPHSSSIKMLSGVWLTLVLQNFALKKENNTVSGQIF